MTKYHDDGEHEPVSAWLLCSVWGKLHAGLLIKSDLHYSAW